MLAVLCGIVYVSVHNDMCRGVRTDQRLGFSFVSMLHLIL